MRRGDGSGAAGAPAERGAVARAFVAGGCAAALAQVACTVFRLLGLSAADAVSAMMVTLGAAGALAAGHGWYRALEGAAGMGTAMPISGLASLTADRVAARVAAARGAGGGAAAVRAVLSGVGGVLVNFAPGCAVALALAITG